MNTYRAIFKDADGIPRVFGYAGTKERSVEEAQLALLEYLQVKHAHGFMLNASRFTLEVENTSDAGVPA